MILCFPYHPALPLDYGKFTEELKRRLGNKSHTVLVLSRPQDEDAAFTIATNLSNTFGRHFTGVLVRDGSTPIETANMFFQTALRFLAQYDRKREAHEPPGTPMLYMDPTYRPEQNHWLSEIQSEFFLKGAPNVMGDYGSPEAPDFKGAFVISPKYAQTSTLVNFLDAKTYWRKFLAWELLANSVFTDSISELVTLRPENAHKR